MVELPGYERGIGCKRSGGMAKKKTTLMRCRECGFPRFVSFFIKWNDNGTITQVMRKEFRVVLLHAGFVDNLFENIEARLGVSIEHIAFEAQRNASKSTFEAFTEKIPGINLGLKLNLAKKIGVDQFHKVGMICGQCLSETISYEPGVKGVARISNPFNMNLMAANVVGAFEALEHQPFKQSWVEEGPDSYIITVEPTGEKPEIANRMALEFKPTLPHSHYYERCPRCKMPLALMQLKWMENEGIIVDTRTGSRVIMLDGYMVTTVFREMVNELGDEVNALLVDAQRQWTVDHVEQLGLHSGNGPISGRELEASFRKYMEMLPLYGQGMAVGFKVEESPEGPIVNVRIENAYEQFVLAGTLEGLYEALRKSKADVTWESPTEHVINYRIAPA